MSTKSMAYDHPAYTVRLFHQPAAQPAGASKTYDKFLAYAACTVFAVQSYCVTAGTSSYTAWNGTATVTTTGTGDTITCFRVAGSAGGTATFGPFAIDAAVGNVNRIQLFGTGTASYLGSQSGAGGVQLNAGDLFYMQRGTDATAVQVPCVEIGFQPGANFTV
jgi:hypothetical protein